MKDAVHAGQGQKGDTKMEMYSRLITQNRGGAGVEAYFAREGADPLRHAFERKPSVHAGMGGKPLAKEAADETLARLRRTPRTGKTAAYLHIPFCRTHCLYCGFFNRRHDPDLASAYAKSLVEELRMCADDPSVNSGPVHCVYIGGGTPSDLDAADLAEILRAVRLYLPLANDCEITVEARIRGFDDARIEACLGAGANRFSLGVQTFDTGLRQGLGRLAARDEVLARLERLAAYDQAAVVVDLIYGLPGQTMRHWEEDIAAFLGLGLDGVDLYQLNVFKGSPLSKAIERGGLPPAASVPEQGEMFARGVELMQAARFSRLSISHWGRSTRERNLYNLLIKGRSHCLAMGAGAGGNLFDHFMFNDNDVDRYLAAVARGEKPVVMMAAPPPDVWLNKGITAGLERLALDLRSLGEAVGEDLEGVYEPLLAQWERVGLVRRENGWIDLTLAGQFWEVNLAQAMIDFYKITKSAKEDCANAVQ